MDETPTWIEKLNIKPGDHVLAIVTDGDDISLLPPYASDAMAKGHHCSIFVANEKLDALRRYMRNHGVAVDEGERSGQVMFGDPREIGQNEAGEFDTRVLVQNMARFAETLDDRNIQHLRCIGSLSWLKGTATPNDGIYLCARLNEIFKGKPVSGLCIWNSRQFGGDVIVNALRTHPKILLKGEVTVNALYKQPADVIASLGRS